MTLLDLITTTLIVWITARLLIYERGPLAIFARWRDFIGLQVDDFGNPTALTTEAHYLFSCLTCLSFWLAAAWVAWHRLPVEYVLVYTGGSVLLNRISG
jgi:hypothetical protein